MLSVHERLVLDNASSMHPIECLLQYYLTACVCVMLVCGIHCSPSSLPPSSGVLITTTASLVTLWVVTVTVFGVVTAVLSWQIFKLKQKGMLTAKPYR